MGQNNRQRRAAKVRARKRQDRGRPNAGRPGNPAADAAAGPSPRSRDARGPGGGAQPGIDWDVLRKLDRDALVDQDSEADFSVIDEDEHDAGGSSPYDWATHSSPPDDRLIDAAIDECCRTYHAPSATPGIGRLLLHDDPQWRVAIDRRLAPRLITEVRACWQRGWLPLDLHRVAADFPYGTAVLSDAMAADLSTYAAATVDRRFIEQFRDLKAGVWWPASQSWLTARASRPGHDWGSLLSTVIGLMISLRQTGSIPRICPPPGEAVPAAASHTHVDDKVLERVRQLLAKAESTTFEAEAETFTAGAQALMARHSIDAAVLASTTKKSDGPSSSRLYIDAPYEAAKVDLLTVIAGANRCRPVWFKQLKFVSVVGFDADLVAVETLFTSLLVQAVASMQRHGSRRDGYGRSRTRAFRSSFLTAFAHRIGERLTQVAEEEVSRASGEAAGAQLLPVLAAREAQVDAAFEQLFPNARFTQSRVSRDAEGWRAGRAAADQAALKYGAALA